MNSINKFKILNVYLHIIDYEKLLIYLFDNYKKGYVTLNGVHGVIEAYDNKLVEKSINSSTFALCDGRPLYKILKKNNAESIDHITGRVLMLEVCKRAEKENLSIGIYGGTKNNQQKCIYNLKKKFPKLKIDFYHSPESIAFNQKEDQLIIDKINQSKISFLFVCLGCPKQEVWMNIHSKELSCFLLGVGAAIDYIAKSLKPPPQLITKLSLEWLYRLILEPKRLYKRYFYIIPKFIYLNFLNKIKKI